MEHEQSFVAFSSPPPFLFFDNMNELCVNFGTQEVFYRLRNPSRLRIYGLTAL
jgi:hypothetical protein